MKRDMLEILDYIKSSDSPCTSEKLASYFSVSTRTIKSYVKIINKENNDVIQATSKGYCIDKNAFAKINRIEKFHKTAKERLFVILKKLLSSNDPIDIFDFIEELYVSYSTIKNDITKIREEIKKYNLSILIKNDTLILKGDEVNKRKLISDLLYKESKNNFLNYDQIQKQFSKINIDEIKKIYKNKLKKFNYYINGYSLTNLVLHTAITIDRIQNISIDEEKKEKFQQLDFESDFMKMTTEIAEALEKLCDIKFSDFEKHELPLLILSRTSKIGYHTLNPKNYLKYIHKDCLTLAKELLKKIEVQYDIDLIKKEQLDYFAFHLQSLFARLNNDRSNRNPLTANIKRNSPFFFDMAVDIAHYIKSNTGIQITEDEISYIAIHLGCMIGEINSNYHKINCILYCPDYYKISTHLMSKLEELFSEKLMIIDIVSDETQVQKITDADLILSVLPINKSKAIHFPILEINLFLTKKDEVHLSRKIEEIFIRKKQANFLSQLKNIMLFELFEKKDSFETVEDCIKYMCVKIEKAGYSTQKLYEQVIEREQIASTAFDLFAIPHSIQMDAKKTIISTMILDKPIIWNKTANVRLVLLICFNKNDRSKFQSLYETISSVLIEKDNIKKLINAKNFKDFLNIFADCIE